MDGTGGGNASFDVATGVVLAMNVAMDATVSGQTVAEGVTADVTGTSRITGEVVNTLAVPGEAQAATASPATAAPEAGSAPEAPATTETYADATVTVRLTGDQIELELGGQVYPGRVTRRDGSAIEGEFTASGATFPFTATLAGERLTLESGGGTDQLDRQAPVANPLGTDGAGEPGGRRWRGSRIDSPDADLGAKSTRADGMSCNGCHHPRQRCRSGTRR